MKEIETLTITQLFEALDDVVDKVSPSMMKVHNTTNTNTLDKIRSEDLDYRITFICNETMTIVFLINGDLFSYDVMRSLIENVQKKFILYPEYSCTPHENKHYDRNYDDQHVSFTFCYNN